MITRSIVGLVLAGTMMTPVYAADTNIKQREAASKAVTKELVKQLGGKLKAEMKANGPVGAIKVCRDEAPAIANALSLKNGWRVTRVSTRPRNAMLGTPDAYERSKLVEFEKRAKKGESYETMYSSEVVTEGDKTYYRFLKAIPTGDVCLTCHGSKRNIPANLAAAINESYPHDKATGFGRGQLRGAVSIKQPMD